MKPLTKFIPRIKKEYIGEALTIKNTHEHPMFQFDTWFKQAHDKETSVEVNAFCLSTYGQKNMPNSRIVLMKAYDENGVVFFTNYTSTKAKDIEHNNSVSALFYWPDTNRQVRIQGKAFKTDKDYNKEYFGTRPFESRLASYFSKQSEVMTEEDKREYTELIKNTDENTFDGDIDGKWGGYLIVPESVEFWQGNVSRIHDRIRYDQSSNGTWDKAMLYP